MYQACGSFAFMIAAIVGQYKWIPDEISGQLEFWRFFEKGAKEHQLTKCSHNVELRGAKHLYERFTIYVQKFLGDKFCIQERTKFTDYVL